MADIGQQTPPFDPYQRPPRPPSSTAGFWVLLTLIVVAAGAIGTVAYLRQQDESSGSVAADATAAAPTTLAVPQTATPTTPAPATIAPLTIPPPLIPGAPIPATPPLTPDPSEQTFEFLVRRYDTAASDSPVIDHAYTYDTAGDVWRVITSSTAQPKGTVTEFGTTYRVVSYPDATLERIPRSPASLSPEPDLWFARRLGQADLVPDVGLPFTTVVSVERQESEGGPITVVGAQLDVAAFAAAQPDAHAEWVWKWASQSPFDPTLVDPTGRQLATDAFARNDDAIPPLPFSEIEIEMEVDRVGIIYVVADDGTLRDAIIIDPIDGFRTWYAFDEASDTRMNVGGFERYTWVDAPA